MNFFSEVYNKCGWFIKILLDKEAATAHIGLPSWIIFYDLDNKYSELVHKLMSKEADTELIGFPSWYFFMKFIINMVDWLG